MPKKINYESMFTRRTDGRWMGYWHDADGKRHAIYDRDAKRLYDRIAEKESPPPLLFCDIAEMWYDYKWEQLRPGTQSCYLSAYNRAIAEFGERIPSEIEPHEIKNHLNRMAAQNYSVKTIKTQRLIYKMIFAYACADKIAGQQVKSNPADLSPLPSKMKPPSRRDAPSEETIAKIRENASSAYFGLFALFLVSTGCRRGEALAVRWRDIDLVNDEIAITASVSHRGGRTVLSPVKTENAVRTVPLLADLKAHLIKPQGAKADDFVFYGSDPSEPIPAATYDRRWMHYCKDMGFVTDEPEERKSKQGKKYTVHNYKPTLTAHYLRHGYATMLFEAEIDEFTAQRLLGHASIETTRAIYTHLREQKNKESITKLKKYVAAQI